MEVPDVSVSPGLSLHEALERWAAERPAATFVQEVEQGRALSFADYLAAVRGLRRRLGDEQRTIVLTLPGGVAASVVWLAALCGGHRLLPCSPELGEDEAARLAATYQPDLLVVETPEVAERFGRCAAPALTRAELEAAIDDWVRKPETGDVDWRGGELCLTTSGTTGTPKGIRLRADQLAWTAEQIRISHRLTAADRGLAVLPFFHINAPVVSLCTTLLAGGTLVIAPRFSRGRFWNWIEDERITWASIVPTIVAVLLQTERPAWLPGTLRFVRTASAPLPAVQLRAFERRFGIPVIETYGLSEAASTVCANPVPPERHKPGSVGRPLGLALRVCQPQTQGERLGLLDVPAGVEGEVCISGPNVIAGYDGGASAASFQDGWFRTGDLGYLDADGYLFITGRLKDVINRGGEKIAPREVEELLLTHPAVIDAAVIGRADPIYGEVPVAYVIPAPHARVRGTFAAPLKEFCTQRLSPYKVPVEFVEVDSLPRTRTGKIQRHVLRAAPEVQAAPAWRYGVASA